MCDVAIINKSKSKISRIPISLIKNDILGKKYSLSLALVSQNQSKEINNKYRKINKPTNILSFVLSKNSGEIILCPYVIIKEAYKFNKSYRQFLGFLIIHGMLHLKGIQHGSKIEIEEKKYYEKYFSSNRRGVVYNARSRGRVSKRRKKS